MNFEIATPTRIVFGEGRVKEAGSIVAAFGTRALVVEGRGRRADRLVESLEASGVQSTRLQVEGEPTIEWAEAGLARAREAGAEVVVGIGGGSVIDGAKAISALLTNGGDPREYLEVIGTGRALEKRAAPYVAIPTTAGTGAEVTRNAVLSASAERIKVSLRSPLMIPAVALIDPELTYTLPPEITASTGMDALTQCIEPFVTPLANPITDALAREGIARAARSLRAAFQDGTDVNARRDMAIASLCGGLALANAKLGAVHGFAAPLGGMFPIPHGVACARLLPLIVEVNVRSLLARAPTSPAIERYEEIARALTGDPAARAEDAVAWLHDLSGELRIPGLSAYGLTEAEIEDVAQKARRSSSMQGNPIELTEKELVATLLQAL